MTEKIINKFIKKGLILKEEKEIYICGLEQTLAYILNIISMLIIASFFNLILEGILFTITYTCIRIYAGGYHTRTQLRYYIFSILILITVFFIINLKLIANSIIIAILSIISSGIILYLAPVEDENKLLDEIEIKVYTKITIRNLIILLIALCITLIYNKINVSVCICISLLCNGIMLILGKINNSIRYKYSK